MLLALYTGLGNPICTIGYRRLVTGGLLMLATKVLGDLEKKHVNTENERIMLNAMLVTLPFL